MAGKEDPFEFDGSLKWRNDFESVVIGGSANELEIPLF